MKKLLKLFFVLLLTGAMSISTVKQVDAAGVKLSTKKATVRVSRNFVLTLKNTKVSAKAKASNSKIKIKKIKKNKWKITGKKTGKATVTVKVNKKTYKCKVIVKKAFSANEKWKIEYLKIVKQKHKKTINIDDGVDINAYKLVDINSDGIPELYIDYQNDGDGAQLYTYYKKKITHLNCGTQVISYIKGKKNKIHDEYGKMGLGYDKIYRLRKGKFKLLNKGTLKDNEDKMDSIFDSKGRMIYDHYYWNGKKVSRSKYLRLLHKAFNEKKAKYVIPPECDTDDDVFPIYKGVHHYGKIVKVIKAYK